MQAITVKYLPATNHRGSRLKAECEAGSLTIDYPHELNHSDVWQAAADALVKKLGWTDPNYGKLVGGQIKDGRYVFVFCQPDAAADLRAARLAAGMSAEEPKYPRNVCPVCHETMLGSHYHESDDDRCAECGRSSNDPHTANCSVALEQDGEE